MFLIPPDGTRVELFTDVGGDGDNFTNTILDDEASMPITDGTAPFTGYYRPEGNLSNLDGKSITGTWTLEVSDDYYIGRGELNSWCLIIEAASVCPLDPPVIQAEPRVPGGNYDTIIWNDVGAIRQYSSLDVPKGIPDSGTATSTLVIDDFGAVEDLNVNINISHSKDEDLQVSLIAPDDTQVELFTAVGGSGNDFKDTTLDDQALVSINQGSAPFTGSYRPEGSLADFIGTDINGTWTLEVIDNNPENPGTLNSWSLTVDVANVVYYAECDLDTDFVNVVANSGWIFDTSYTFTVLDPKQYWYRAKARLLEKWSQTSRADFETCILTNTTATSDGDVELAVGGGIGPQVHVIENPSFESEGGWAVGSNSVFLLIGTGIYPDDIWASDGRRVGGVVLSDNFLYEKGDFTVLVQTVDWTGVGTLKFDHCSIFGNELLLKVIIGNTEVWSYDPTGVEDIRYDEEVNVSAINGHQDLNLLVEVKKSGSYLAGVFWDNLRTYGSGSDYMPSGNIVSPHISIADNDTWDTVEFNATIPAGTSLGVDVLPETGSNPIPGYANIVSGTDLSGLSQRTIRLRANLSTSNPSTTPVLHDWSIIYTNAACESDWSNVVGSSL